MQEETYLLVCQRYIELNPVRAARVDDPANYRWSSYRGNALGQPDGLLTAHPLYMALGTDEASRQAAYRTLFRQPLDAEALGDICLAVRQNQPLGNARFLDMIECMTGQRREAKPRGRPRKTTEQDEALAGQVALDL